MVRGPSSPETSSLETSSPETSSPETSSSEPFSPETSSSETSSPEFEAEPTDGSISLLISIPISSLMIQVRKLSPYRVLTSLYLVPFSWRRTMAGRLGRSGNSSISSRSIT
eukprot:Protomagalhaensia_wolfi_Nauph_80__1728@NODE_2074_length_1224_cov_4_371308_g1620_i0_p2_GENE_NODE_2074_length_1224_cov_4_371308_g1620_i0NODE_2074_length_1224_cov_4_371308_g1620_i0_p2_ORF_typecomplete_len111_score10_34TMEM154/PF15102_6/0_023Trypan_PARP/PF05887_11/0_19_NODE_2074_length_1224_cov_4_371308_g1620_i0142474